MRGQFIRLRVRLRESEHDPAVGPARGVVARASHQRRGRYLRGAWTRGREPSSPRRVRGDSEQARGARREKASLRRVFSREVGTSRSSRSNRRRRGRGRSPAAAPDVATGSGPAAAALVAYCDQCLRLALRRHRPAAAAPGPRRMVSTPAASRWCAGSVRRHGSSRPRGTAVTVVATPFRFENSSKRQGRPSGLRFANRTRSTRARRLHPEEGHITRTGLPEGRSAGRSRGGRVAIRFDGAGMRNSPREVGGAPEAAVSSTLGKGRPTPRACDQALQAREVAYSTASS